MMKKKLLLFVVAMAIAIQVSSAVIWPILIQMQVKNGPVDPSLF